MLSQTNYTSEDFYGQKRHCQICGSPIQLFMCYCTWTPADFAVTERLRTHYVAGQLYVQEEDDNQSILTQEPAVYDADLDAQMYPTPMDEFDAEYQALLREMEEEKEHIIVKKEEPEEPVLSTAEVYAQGREPHYSFALRENGTFERVHDGWYYRDEQGNVQVEMFPMETLIDLFRPQ